MPIFLVVILLVVGAFGFWYWSKRQARAKLLQTALSDRQRAIVVRRFPLYRKLPVELLRKLEGKINVFLRQIDFVGCDGLDVTEEMRLSIAAQACLLVVNNDAWYTDLRTILIYPDAFRSPEITHDGYVVTERESVRVGESWSRGPVVLSWAHAEQGAVDREDGHNVVLHEFAHQLDSLSGHTDGAPILNKGQSFADWERVIVDAYDRHVENAESVRETALDIYGADGLEEFFAVAVELFFEKPWALRREEPEVYDQLSAFFRLDPISWG